MVWGGKSLWIVGMLLDVCEHNGIWEKSRPEPQKFGVCNTGSSRVHKYQRITSIRTWLMVGCSLGGWAFPPSLGVLVHPFSLPTSLPFFIFFHFPGLVHDIRSTKVSQG